jgi:thiamine pyrophosphokinase
MSDAKTRGEDQPDADHTRTVAVFTGGTDVGGHGAPDLDRLLPENAYVIAADSGLHHALAHGRRVDLVVGDFDSVAGEALVASSAVGARAVRYPTKKDETDLELAMNHAMEVEPARVVVIGGYGGRLDHFLANIALLASARYQSARVEAHFDEGSVHVVRDETEIVGRPGNLVSLLPTHGPARGVRTVGLLYPLHGETLESGSSRGVSNQFVTDVATVQLERGVLLVVIPAPAPPSTPRPHREPME